MQRETIAKRKQIADLAVIMAKLHRLEVDTVCHFRHMIQVALLARTLSLWEAIDLAKKHELMCTDQEDCARQVTSALIGIAKTINATNFARLQADPTLRERLIIRGLRRHKRVVRAPKPSVKAAQPPKKKVRLEVRKPTRFGDKRQLISNLQLGYLEMTAMQR